MKAMICTQCGGQINPETHKCEFCGVYYKEEVAIEVVGERDDYKTISAYVTVPYHRGFGAPSELSQDIAERDSYCAIENIRQSLAEAILPFIDITVGMPDLRSMTVPIAGRVRVKKIEHDKARFY